MPTELRYVINHQALLLTHKKDSDFGTDHAERSKTEIFMASNRCAPDKGCAVAYYTCQLFLLFSVVFGLFTSVHKYDTGRIITKK